MKIPRSISICHVVALALILGSALLASGCVALGLAVVPATIVGAYAVGGAAVEVGKKIDARGRPPPVPTMSSVEREIRSLLPAAPNDTSFTTGDPPGTPSRGNIQFAIGGETPARTQGSGNVPSLFITITGDLSPATARRLAGGVRQIAWRRADPIVLRIFGRSDGTEDRPHDLVAHVEDFFFAPRGLTKLVECEFNPDRDVREKLTPLIPRTASGRTGLWGQKSWGGLRLDPGPQIEAWGDFSAVTAQAFLQVSQTAFPHLAVTVCRDETRDRKGWKTLATFSPQMPANQSVPAPPPSETLLPRLEKHP